MEKQCSKLWGGTGVEAAVWRMVKPVFSSGISVWNGVAAYWPGVSINDSGWRDGKYVAFGSTTADCKRMIFSDELGLKHGRRRKLFGNK
jgi:hypothetical protein